ncbi:MAG: NfeD family protein, partial [Phycisphaerae bacterium]
MRRPRREVRVIALVLCLLTTGLLAEAPATRPAEAPRNAIVTPIGWFPPPVRSVPKPTLPDPVERAFRINIHGPITPATYDIVKRKVIRCRAENAQFVVFDMNTPGGRSDAMSNIIDLITQDLNGVYTVAYVHPEAISAGAIISLACTEIVMAPDGTIGDAMPIMISGGKPVPIPKEERGKIESYARAEVRVLAQRNGYPEPLCEGMITMSREIWLLRKPDTGQLRIVEADRWRNVPGSPDPDRDLTRTPPESGWEFARKIDGPDSIVTLTTQEAVEIGLCRHTFAGLDELASHYNVAGEIQLLETTGLEEVMAFLTSPAVSGLLIMVGVLAIYMELNSPGLGIPAIVAIIAFGILFGARYLTGLAQWWEVGLFVVGIALLAAEIFVIPGFGVAGISGILCCLVALFAMVMPNAPGELPLPSTAL